MLRLRSRPPVDGHIEPCLPSPAPKPPAGPGWVHEIKHDGYRLIARRQGGRLQLLTRNGHDWRERYPAIAAALAVLPVRSCMIDGEAIACDERGLAVFQLLRRRAMDESVALCAFDLLELDGEDLRRAPLEERKARLAWLLRRPLDGIILNQHLEADGAMVFRHACALGCEGIVSKRLGSRYRSGRTADWIKLKNPAAPAVQREAEEDWDGARLPRRR